VDHPLVTTKLVILIAWSVPYRALNFRAGTVRSWLNFRRERGNFRVRFSRWEKRTSLVGTDQAINNTTGEIRPLLGSLLLALSLIIIILTNMTKKLSGVILLLVMSSFLMAGELYAISWMTDLRAAVDEAGREGKPILVDFYTDWCGWCSKMDKDTYGNRAVNGLATDFVCVKINGDKQKQVVQRYKINAYPTTLFLDDKGMVVERVRGYMAPKQFIRIMESVRAKYLRPARKKPEKPERPRSGHELNGIISGGDRAIVNNTIVSVGDTVDGAEVLKITYNSVTLSCQDKEIVLTIE
ncbi:MAG: thioredoxin family protein, partial [Candidatus Omnitrophota bacterium]